MNEQTHLNGVFDQLMLEVESSGFETASILLTGIIDGALAAGMAIDVLRAIVFDHPVSEILGRASCYSAKPPKSPAKFGLGKALSSREAFIGDAIEKGWKRGKRICVLGPAGHRGIEKLGDRDTSNVSLFSGNTEHTFSDYAGFWDQVIAGDIANALGRDALAEFIAATAGSLAPDGKIQLAALTPRHIGSGWLSICNKNDTHYHTADEIRSLAREAGLKFSHFFDASGSLIWAELQSPKDKN